MAKVVEKLDAIEARVMAGLKDFQRATVERIDWLYRQGQRRVLVADEVGLGKTLIARGTVAKMAVIRHRIHHDELFKVIYVCSNAAIAGQNLDKLRITPEAKMEDVASSRLSMQHLRIFQQENDPELRDNYIQLIPLTPETSFNVSAGVGRVEERALMFVHLCHLQELKSFQKKLEVIMQQGVTSWERCLDKYDEMAKKCNEQSKKCGTNKDEKQTSYFQYMEQELRHELL